MGGSSQAAGLRAYRVKRKLLGQTGAPTVTRTEEFWRISARRYAEGKAHLETFLKGWRREGASFQGSGMYPISIDGNGEIWTWNVRDGGGFIRSRSAHAGRIFRDGTMVLHYRRAPRWLRNWAATQDKVYVLRGISRRMLRAHLVKLKLTENAPYGPF